MTTNPIGPNTKNITINVSKETKKDLDKLAEGSNLILSTYIRGLFYEAIRKKSIVVEERYTTYSVKDDDEAQLTLPEVP